MFDRLIAWAVYPLALSRFDYHNNALSLSIGLERKIAVRRKKKARRRLRRLHIREGLTGRFRELLLVTLERYSV